MVVRETTRRQADFFNAHDAHGYASGYTQGAVVIDPMYPDPLRGTAAIRKDISEFFTAFPDAKVEVTGPIEDGNTGAYEILVTGTHAGPLVGPTGHIPATNRKVTLRGGAFVRLNGDGRIEEEHRYFDLAGLLGQLGLMQ